MSEFLENLVFEMAKDSEIATAQLFKEKYIDYDIDHSKVYKKIVNYRISKYGNSFNIRGVYIDRKRAKSNSDARKYQWRKRNGKVIQKF